MEDKTVYLDHAATTYVKSEVFDAMKPYFSEHFGNASSIYSLGRDSKKAVEESREKVANAIGAEPREIYFTGSGSEADNWALKGIAAAFKKKGNHIITSAIEHPAIMSSCKYLEGEGFEITYLPVDSDGLVTPEQVRDAIRDNTILISIMFANNEIGTIQPIKEIGAIAKEKGVLFHTDAVQAVGNIRIDVKELNVDLLSLSSHKFYGPKGIGALYIKKGIKIPSFIHGGQQERGKRASTENVPAIIGLGKAIEIATENLDEYNKKLTEFREKTIEGLFAKVPYIRLNGHRHNRLPGNVNISFEFIEGESLLLMLDMKGICGSSGSACSSGSLDPSHVLLAIGLPHEIAHGSLRLTFGDENTHEDVDYILEVIPQMVRKLRDMSPLWEAVKDKK
ncbi:cysteine desulfurase NifS [Ruminiclostridium cellulolyticum]|uniref:Cysteine desulfurase IscS n=1 Tax=Ruminiclostridium cellulolyticum (strain ATCC 35319 / DSM 5812 / JCM 6584 / H10) TaxID=394503 RepID=B8I3D7_RUMCH|nr:cysteine desulfurase NifS [Ruminiclostridium cellulolyticum]ACL76280.1 cysteine desulfurase NifS [Ruminiclostridium cellulolyticum H10]